MKILGFNFTKISAEKFSGNFKEMKVGNKIDIMDVSDAKQDIIKTKDELLNIKFFYGLDYSENIAKIGLEGNLLVSVDSKTYKEVMKRWKDKETPDEFRFVLLNIILKKSTLKILELEEELGIPFHIQFPSFRKKE